MAGNKYLSNNSGTMTEVAAAQTSAGAGDAGKVVALNSAGAVDLTMMPSGIGPSTSSVLASEALAAGDLVNIWNNSGTANVRKADGSTTGKQADGCVLSSVSSGATALVYPPGSLNNAVSSLTPGPQFLSDTTAGKTAATAPTTSGHTVQRVGSATTASALIFQPQAPIVLA